MKSVTDRPILITFTFLVILGLGIGTLLAAGPIFERGSKTEGRAQTLEEVFGPEFTLPPLERC
jgi:hypothetical protein